MGLVLQPRILTASLATNARCSPAFSVELPRTPGSSADLLPSQPLPREGSSIPTATSGLAELQGVLPSLSSLLQVPLNVSPALKQSSLSADEGDFCLLCRLLIRIWIRIGPRMGLGGASLAANHQVGYEPLTTTL